MWNLKNKTNKTNNLIDTENKRTVGTREGGERMGENGITKHKSPGIKAVTDVKCSTGNVVHYTVILLAVCGVRWVTIS